MLERNVKDKIKRLIAKYEQAGDVFWYYMPVQTGMGRMGIPDFLICIHGWLVAIETKVNCREPTTRQSYELEDIRLSRGVTLVIDQHNINDADRVFEALVRGNHIEASSIAERSRNAYSLSHQT